MGVLIAIGVVGIAFAAVWYHEGALHTAYLQGYADGSRMRDLYAKVANETKKSAFTFD